MANGRGKLKKDILYTLGLEEGFIKVLQDTVLTLIRGKIGQVAEGAEVKVKGIRDRNI